MTRLGDSDSQDIGVQDDIVEREALKTFVDDGE
jgi:hypothetical protein